MSTTLFYIEASFKTYEVSSVSSCILFGQLKRQHTKDKVTPLGVIFLQKITTGSLGTMVIKN